MSIIAPKPIGFTGKIKVKPDIMKELSVIIPVYGCAECLRALYSRLIKTLEYADYELIFIDDCARDNSWHILQDMAENDRNVIAMRLSRNFGQHAAITAGLFKSNGRRAVVMDCDLQDPPEVILQLLAEADKGCDIVYARRLQKKHSKFRRLSAKVYSLILHTFTNARIDGDFGSFSIISRKVIDAFLLFKDEDRHYLHILNWLGFSHSIIDYEHADRFAGQSSYNIKLLVGHALDGLFFQTTVLLKWIVYSGFLISFTGLTLAVYYVIQYFVYNIQPGWTSLVVLILLMSGFIITSLGITALYIGRVFNQVRQRPLFVIDKIING